MKWFGVVLDWFPNHYQGDRRRRQGGWRAPPGDLDPFRQIIDGNEVIHLLRSIILVISYTAQPVCPCSQCGGNHWEEGKIRAESYIAKAKCANGYWRKHT